MMSSTVDALAGTISNLVTTMGPLRVGLNQLADVASERANEESESKTALSLKKRTIVTVSLA